VGLLLNSPFGLGPNATMPGKFVGWDTNYNAKYKPISIPFFSINIFFDTICMVWGIYMLYGRFLSGHIGLNISTVCITLELLSVLCRQIGHILAIFIQTVPYVPIGYQFPLGFYFLATPFDLSAGIFLLFFWIDITSSSLYHGAFLDKAFWPAMVLTIITYIVIGIPTILLFIGYLPFGNTLFTGLTQYVNGLLFIISILYFIAAHRVHQYTKNRKDPIIIRAFFIMMIKIILSGVVMFFVIILSISFVFAQGNSPGYIFVKFLYDCFYTIRSYLMIDLFGSPPRDKSKSTTSKENSNTNSSQLSSTATT